MSPVGLPCLLLVSLVGFQSGLVLCYSNGKVSRACGSMVPQHSGSGQTSPSPYGLQTSTTTFSPKDQIRGDGGLALPLIWSTSRPVLTAFSKPLPQSPCLERRSSRASCSRPETPSIQAQRPPSGPSRSSTRAPHSCSPVVVRCSSAHTHTHSQCPPPSPRWTRGFPRPVRFLIVEGHGCHGRHASAALGGQEVPEDQCGGPPSAGGPEGVFLPSHFSLAGDWLVSPTADSGGVMGLLSVLGRVLEGTWPGRTAL